MATEKTTMNIDELKATVDKVQKQWHTEHVILQKKKDAYVEQQFKTQELHIQYLNLSNTHLQALLQQQQSMSSKVTHPVTEEQKTADTIPSS